MDKIILNVRDIRKLNLIGEGSESYVYDYLGQALKLFSSRFITEEKIENKINKIEKLKELNLGNFVIPHTLVQNDDNKTIGYIMEKIDYEYDLYDLLKSNNITLNYKIHFLKKYNELIRLAHENDITLIDANFWNCLISNNDVFFIDTDNYKIGDLQYDLLPNQYKTIYMMLNKKMPLYDQNYDNFQIGIQIFSKLIDLGLSNYMIYPEILKTLSIDKKSYEYFENILLPYEDKMYIDNNLDELSSTYKTHIKKNPF